MDDVEPFYHLRVEDVVPRDAAWLVVGGSIAVVPPRAFEGYENLARVEFREGVEEIGRSAFEDCPNLTRVGGASSLRTIGDAAFDGCGRLSEVELREGLRRIGAFAFFRCPLERIAVPSSVVDIGNLAFAGCKRLSEAILREGLRRIEGQAFHGCGLRRIAIPSSVVKIGDSAFHSCGDLEAVTLAGGMVLVVWGAFFCCPRLDRIQLSSVAIVVKAGAGNNGRTAVVTGGIVRDAENDPPQLILASPHLVSMRTEDLTNVTEAIDQIVVTTQAAGLFELMVGDVSGRIRSCFVERLATWYEWYKNEVAAILELRLWDIELSRAREAGRGRGHATGGGKRARADVPTRDDFRRTCGADPIVGLVLSSLAGPHRRVDREGNEPIQP